MRIEKTTCEKLVEGHRISRSVKLGQRSSNHTHEMWCVLPLPYRCVLIGSWTFVSVCVCVCRRGDRKENECNSPLKRQKRAFHFAIQRMRIDATNQFRRNP
jgi:hypothetical protein